MKISVARDKSQVENEKCNLTKCFRFSLRSPGCWDMLPPAPHPGCHLCQEVGRVSQSDRRAERVKSHVCDGIFPEQGSRTENGRGHPAKGREASEVTGQWEAGGRQTSGESGSDRGPGLGLSGCQESAKKWTEALNAAGACKLCQWTRGAEALPNLSLLPPCCRAVL